MTKEQKNTSVRPVPFYVTSSGTRHWVCTSGGEIDTATGRPETWCGLYGNGPSRHRVRVFGTCALEEITCKRCKR